MFLFKKSKCTNTKQNNFGGIRNNIDSNYIGQLNENPVYAGQGFNGYIQSINAPENNQLNGDYPIPYLRNLYSFETCSSPITGNNAVKDGPYSTPNLFTSDNNVVMIIYI